MHRLPTPGEYQHSQVNVSSANAYVSGLFGRISKGSLSKQAEQSDEGGEITYRAGTISEGIYRDNAVIIINSPSSKSSRDRQLH